MHLKNVPHITKILVIACLSAGSQTIVAQQQNDIIEDPLYNTQWHLENTGQSSGKKGEDIKVREVWKNFKGEGVYISIVDNDIQLNHEDLEANISTQHSIDYYPSFNSRSSHGTRVAGVAAARDNTVGVRGVAPRATMYSSNILGNTHSGKTQVHIVDLVDAMTRHSSITAISNNSWGHEDPFRPFGNIRIMWQAAIEKGINSGFHGKGIVYVFAAGNSHCNRTICHADSSNYDGLTNHHATIAVCSVNNQGRHISFSEWGANLWVCAPSRNIQTTTRSNSYTQYFSGTSTSAPMVSGVVALMRQANPNLGWRDVQLILANSARQNDTADNDWMQGDVKYGSFPTDADRRYQFNHKYGFGVVNAEKAVELAKAWLNLPPREIDTWGSTSNVQVNNSAVTSNIFIQSDINFIEYLDIYINTIHNGFNDLRVNLTSPSGNISELVTPSSAASTNTDIVIRKVDGIWRFGSARHLGEDPTGVWKLTFENTRSSTGTLIEWGINVRGHKTQINAIADKELIEAGIANEPEQNLLSLSLAGAKWNPILQKSDFELRNAPSGLRIADITTDTRMVKLKLELNEGFAGDHRFRIEATTGTVSGRTEPMLSNDIEIFSNKPMVRHTLLAPDGAVDSNYKFTINNEEVFASAEKLIYRIDGLEVQSGLTTSITTDSITIGGIPTTATIYHVTITAATLDGDSAQTSFNLRVRPRGYPIVVEPIRGQRVSVNERVILELSKIFKDSDNGNSTLTYSITNNPNWLRYTTATAILSGTTDHTTANGRYRIIITATDKDRKSTDTIFDMEVLIRLYIRTKAFLEGALE